MLACDLSYDFGGYISNFKPCSVHVDMQFMLASGLTCIAGYNTYYLKCIITSSMHDSSSMHNSLHLV